MGDRILRAVASNKNKPPAFMKCQEWPCKDNNPTIGTALDYQTTPETNTTVADLVWASGHVQTNCPPPPPPWQVSVVRGVPSSNITLDEILKI
eukprot:12414119-Karenia_brevis.AAC.1